MKRKILLTLTALLMLGGVACQAQTIYPWRQQISSNCLGLNTITSCGGGACTVQDLCWDTTQKVQYTCDSVSANICTWVAGGGGWRRIGTVLSPLVLTDNVGIGTTTVESGAILDIAGNMHLGANLFRCDATNGCRFDTNNGGATNVSISPAGLFATPGGYNYTGNNPFFNVARTTDESTPATGDAWYNTSGPYWAYYNGAINKRIVTEQTYAITTAPVASSNTLLWQVPYNTRIETIRCIVDPGGSSSAVINIQGCNANGASCASVDTSSITCGNTNSTDDGSLASPSITAGNWVNLNIGTVTGSPAKLTVTVKYSTQP